MDTKSLPPYELKNGTPYAPPILQIRNFRQLLATVTNCAGYERLRQNASAQDDHERDTALVLIQPIDQLIQIEARNQDVSSFNVNADLLCIFGDGRNRWLDYNKKTCSPPQPLKVPRLIISPALCVLWQSSLSPTTETVIQLSSASSSALALNNDLMHLIIVQGLAASECRKFMAVETFHEAASTIFNELANGYSVVFVGLMFKSEFENRMLSGKAYQICKSVDELRHWQSHTVTLPRRPLTPVTPTREKDPKKAKDLPEEPKRFLGIIC